MELHPILDNTTSPNPGLWYVVSSLGDCPSVRVGLACVQVPGPDGCNGKLYVIGGANPSNTFGETYVLDLNTFSWDYLDSPALKPRYEHAAFVPSSQPNKIYVFAGADQKSNHNDLQVLNCDTKKWMTLATRGNPPSARTYHTCACVGDKFVVFGGGHCGSEPVSDRQVHVYDVTTNEWSIISAKGEPPKKRHGHVTVAIGNKVYVHGGMAGQTFFDDLHVFDLGSRSWSNIRKKKVFPCARAAHGAVAYQDAFYVFGGMNIDGALDDLYKFETATNKWSRIELGGPPPTNRLDFGTCRIHIKVPVQDIDTGEMMASKEHAHNVLDQQLRMGSAGSIRSIGSAGSVRSMGSAGSVRSITSSGSHRSTGSGVGAVGGVNVGSPAVAQDSNSAATNHEKELITVLDADGEIEGAGQAVAMTAFEDVEYKEVEMLLVFGGMDTEGEIFNDCLVYLMEEK